MRIDGRSDPEHILCGVRRNRLHSLHRGFALGDRAGLVDRKRPQPSNRLQMSAALYEHAATCHRGQPGDNADGRRNHQRARAGNNQQNAGAIKPVRPLTAEYKRRHHEDCERGNGHTRRVIAREQVDEALCRRLLLLRFFHQANDARERGIAGDLRDLNFEGAFAVDRSREDLIAGFLVHGNRLAGDRRLVDRGFSRHDFSIKRNAHRGLYRHDIADLCLSDWRLHELIAALDRRGLGRDLEQGFHRASRTAVGPSFQPFRDAEKEHDGRRFNPLANDGRADGRDCNEQVDVGPQAKHRTPRFRQQKPTARQHRGEGRRRRGP